MTLIAFCSSCLAMTMEMFNSLEPWAMALTLMPFWPRAWKTLPEVPGTRRMFSPTTAMIERSFSTITGSISLFSISFLNSSSIDFLAVAAAWGSMAKQMECSEEAWLMRMILIFSFARALKRRWETPVTPIMPLPWSWSKAMSLIEEMPLIAELRKLPSLLMTEPAKSGCMVFLMRMGMFFCIAGRIVGGWITLAPKWDISIASL